MLPQILRLRDKYTREEMIASGVEGVFDKAEENFGKIVTKVAKIVAPLNITKGELAELLLDSINKKRA